MDGHLTAACEGMTRLKSAVKGAEEQRASMKGELAAANDRLAKAHLLISGLESRLKEAEDKLATKDDDLKEANKKLMAAELKANEMALLQAELQDKDYDEATQRAKWHKKNPLEARRPNLVLAERD